MAQGIRHLVYPRFTRTVAVRGAEERKHINEAYEIIRNNAVREDLIISDIERAVKMERTPVMLDYSKYYEKLELPIPRNRDKVLEDLANEKFIKRNDAANWDITNLGALMIAKDFKKFDLLAKRTIRVIWYKNDSRLDAVREKEFCAGYILSYEDIIGYIMTVIPREEEIVDGVRKSKFSFPEIAIRELLANIMIHQALE